MILCNNRTVIFYGYLRHSCNRLDVKILRSFYSFNNFPQFLRILGKNVQIISENFHHDILSCSRHQFIETHLHRKLETYRYSGNVLQFFAHFICQFWECGCGSPFFFVFQNHHQIGSIHRHRICRNFTASYFCHDFLNFRKSRFQDMSCLLCTFNGCIQITSRQNSGFYRKISFFKGRNKFTSHSAENENCQYEKYSHDREYHFRNS